MSFRRPPSAFRRGNWILAATVAGAVASAPAVAQNTLAPVGEPPLPDLIAEGVVVDQAGLDLAVVMGKAAFWDAQIGSDGVACASCHFAAGADIRVTNQMNPGFEQKPAADHEFGGVIFDENGDVVASGVTIHGDPAEANYTATRDDFPFRKLADLDDRNSDILFDTNDRFSSQGAFDGTQSTMLVTNSGAVEVCDITSDIFHATFRRRERAVRSVEPRNTPTTINAVFNFNNFWDGRATNVFNGVGVNGPLEAAADPTKRLVTFENGVLGLEAMALEDSSLASQAVGPPLSNLEMSCGDRIWPFIGAKMLNPLTEPLRNQDVKLDDSVLGPYANADGNGLHPDYSYIEMVKQIFPAKYWAAEGYYDIVDNGDGTASIVETDRDNGFTQAELNFAMFFGITVMMYEATLISDQSKFDRVLEHACEVTDAPGPAGWDASACIGVDLGDYEPLTELEADGAFLFTSFVAGPDAAAQCGACHIPTTMWSEAAYFEGDEFDPIEGGGGPGGSTLDLGWHTIGSGGPVSEDLGIGADLVDGGTRSAVLRAKRWLLDGAPIAETPADLYDPNLGVDDPEVCEDFPLWTGVLNGVQLRPTCPGIVGGFGPQLPATIAMEDYPIGEVAGGMKTPGIRNVALTPPYFHYGGYESLDNLMDFYARGGNSRDIDQVVDGVACPAPNDDTGTGATGDVFPVDMTEECVGSNVGIFALNLALDPGNGKDQQYGKDAMVAFMKTWTDARVQCDAAPFDHPSLVITHGHDTRTARDILVELPAVGAGGYEAEGRSDLCLPNAGDLFAPGMQNRVTP